MSDKEKERKAKIQKLEAECFQKTLFGLYRVMLHPDRYIEFWEEVRLIREKYLRELKKIK